MSNYKHAYANIIHSTIHYNTRCTPTARWCHRACVHYMHRLHATSYRTRNAPNYITWTVVVASSWTYRWVRLARKLHIRVMEGWKDTDCLHANAHSGSDGNAIFHHHDSEVLAVDGGSAQHDGICEFCCCSEYVLAKYRVMMRYVHANGLPFSSPAYPKMQRHARHSETLTYGYLNVCIWQLYLIWIPRRRQCCNRIKCDTCWEHSQFTGSHYIELVI